MAERIGIEAVLEDAQFTRGFKRYMDSLGKMDTKTAGTAGRLSQGFLRLGGGVVKFGALAATALIGVGAAAVAGIGAIGVLSTKAAISVESAWAGVLKTTDGLIDEFGDLTESGEILFKGFRDLAKEIPQDVEALMAIGELGGQLGVAEDALLGFTEVIAAMGEATNITSEDAATAFAQISNIMGTSQDDFDRMGSSVVELGNNMATTERDIIGFAQRIAGVGELAGLTEADVFGIAAAFTSVGIQAEAGGTAVQKVLTGMVEAVASGGDELESFASIAGVSAEEFATAFEQDAAGAFTSFVEGLGTAGDQAFTMLEDLGLADQRLIRGFLSLANAGDLTAEAIGMSNEAWEDNLALFKEAEQRYATTESQLKIMKNTFRDLGITIGSAILPFLNKLIKGLKPLIDELGAKLPDILEKHVIPVLEAVFTWLGENIPKAIQAAMTFWSTVLLPALQGFFAFYQSTLAPVFQAIVQFLQDFIPKAIQFFLDHWEAIKTALIAIGAVLAGAGIIAAIASVIAAINPVVLIIGAIVGVIALLSAAWAENWGGIRDIVTEIWENKLQPALTQLIAFFQEFIPRALALAAQYWEQTLLPVIRAVWDFIVANLIPILADLVVWLMENIPVALKAAADFWENVLWPALQVVADFIVEVIIPILSEVVGWLAENIPKAIEAAARFWENVLKPALEVVGNFIINTIIPIIADVVDWLQENIPKAIETAADFWENTLKPALEAVWSFIEGDLIPVIEDIVSIIGTGMLIAIEIGKKAWEKLQPVLETIGKIFKEDIYPIIQDVANFISDTFGPFVTTFVDGALSRFTAALRTLLSVIKKVWTWIGKLLDRLAAIASANLGILQQGSPSPLEKSLIDVSKAAQLLTADIETLTGTIKKMGFDADAAKARMSELNDQIIELEAELEKAHQKYEDEASERYKRKIRRLKSEIEDLKKEYKELNAELQDLDWDAVSSGITSFTSTLKSRLKDIGLRQVEGYLEGNEDAIERINDLIDVEKEQAPFLNPEALQASQQELNRLYEERDRLEGNRVDILKDQKQLLDQIAEIEKKERDLAFLQKQLDLLELIQENELDAFELLGDMELGLEANVEELLDAMSQAMQQLIERAEEELQARSPSKVFVNLAKNVIDSFAGTVDRLKNVPATAIGDAIGGAVMVAAPAPATVSGSVSSRVSNIAQMSLGPIIVQSPTDVGMIEAAVRNVLRRDLGGY